MSLARYDDYVAHLRQHFEEGLIRAGFVESDSGWSGRIPHSDRSTELLITLGAGFPFKPPRVVPVDPHLVPWSWHRELDGALCLVAQDDYEGLWWTEAPAFLEHLAAWLEQSVAGWPDDRPDLDLERYFWPSADARLFLYNDFAGYRNNFVRFRPSANNTMRIGHGTRPVKTSKHSQDRFGYVADLGVVDVPPRSWRDISARINPNVDLDRKIRQHKVAVIVLIYQRGTHNGAVTLEVWPSKDGGIEVRRLRSSADTALARSARAGLQSAALHEYRVAVIGAGALGSFISDMLVRCGVRHLTLVDHDVIMPGNLVRHLVGPDMVGKSKVEAVKQHLVRRNEIPGSNIDAINKALTSGTDAVELLKNHDLVVNATADFATSALLHVTAQSMGMSVLSATLQNDGTTYRIDVLPPLNGATMLPPSTVDNGTMGEGLFEAGCGSPISLAPPHAVAEAAAATVRHAIGLLVQQPLHPAGEVQPIQIVSEESHQ